MAAKKKFYAIARGRRPGIYTNWPQAQAQVAGFKGALYKGFATRAEAETWLENPVHVASKNGKTARVKKYGGPAENGKEGDIVIYTDGGSRFNPGPGGYGVVIEENGKRREYSGGFRLTTNNRMELTACIEALKQVQGTDRSITLYSDSQYVVNGITKGWAKGWRKRGWLKADRQPAINPDLWGELLALSESLDVEFRWVRGHSGNEFNERCDELAVAAAAGENLPEDEGYDG